MYFYLAFFASIFLVTSCNTANHDLPPSSFTSIMPITKAKASKVQLQTFSEEERPALLDLIDYALKNNPKTQMAYLSALAASEDVKAKKSSYYPSINLTANYARARQANFPSTEGLWHSNWGPYLELAYTLLDFGTRRYQLKTAMSQLNSFNYLHTQTLQSIIRVVRDDYYELIAQTELAESAKTNLEYASATLEVAKAKYQLGIVDFLDLSQAKSAYLQNKTNLIRQENAKTKAFYLLASDLGNPTQKPFQIEGFGSIPSITQLRKASHLIAIAQELNPQIQSLVEQVSAAKYTLKSEKTNQWPLITTQLQAGRTYYNSVHDKYDLSLQFNFTLPLYKGGKIKSSVEKAKHNLKLAEQKLQNERNALTYNVLTLRSDLESSFETLDIAAQSLEAAEEQYQVAFSEYKAGTIDILKLINAQANVASSKAYFITAQKTWSLSLTEIALNMGLLVNGKISTDILFKQGNRS